METKQDNAPQVERTHSVQRRRSRQVAKTLGKPMGSPAPRESDLTKMPATRQREVAARLAKVLLSSLLPGVGPLAAELLDLIVAPMVTQRRNEWWDYLGRAVADLQAERADLTVERLTANPAFGSALLQASTVAIRTHQREKLEALRNAVLNVAAGTTPDENLQLTFLTAIDTLTPLHLEFLDCIADPLAWADKRHYPVFRQQQIDARSIFEATYRETLVPGFDQVLLQDLYNRGLAANDFNPGAYGGGSGPETLFPHITEIGRRFLAFITSPIQAANGSDDSTPPDEPAAAQTL
jgi:hypothetical protein